MMLRSNLKGVALREDNVLINYDLMSKDGSDREGKARIVGDMFHFEGWGDGMRDGSLRIDVLINYVLMLKHSSGEGKGEISYKYMSS